MLVLGIDPGTIRMGYGIVNGDGDELGLVDLGVLDASARDPMEKRLLKLYTLLLETIARHKPAVMAVEEPFVVQEARTSGLAVGEARAIALLAAASQGIPVFQYSPNRVRQTISGYGASSKLQVQDMLSLLLRRPLGSYPLDACDAVAVAICHLRQAHLAALVDEQDRQLRASRQDSKARRGR